MACPHPDPQLWKSPAHLELLRIDALPSSFRIRFHVLHRDDLLISLIAAIGKPAYLNTREIGHLTRRNLRDGGEPLLEVPKPRDLKERGLTQFQSRKSWKPPLVPMSVAKLQCGIAIQMR